MRRYLPVAGAGIHALLAYRSTIVLSAVTTGAATALQVFLWLAVYRAADGPLPMPRDSLITYVVLAQLLALLHNNRVDEQVSGEVYRGDIAVSLVRPVSYPLTCLAANLPAAAVSAAVAGVPLLIVFAITTPMAAPTLTGVLLFAVAVPLGVLIAFEVNLMVGLVAFVVTNTWGVRMVKSTVVGLLAGQVVPLSLLPDTARRIVRLLPFQGMIDGPLRLLLGNYDGAGEARGILAEQAIWVALLAGLAALVWRGAVRRIEVLGG
jgi:ABC-2 type transport system permease protein